MKRWAPSSDAIHAPARKAPFQHGTQETTTAPAKLTAKVRTEVVEEDRTQRRYHPMQWH
jgi:hypothetical protein